MICFRGIASSRAWAWKLHKKDKYLYCPIPKAGWSSWKRLWFYTSGVIGNYETDVGIQEDQVAGVIDIAGGSGVKSAWRTKDYEFAFTFFRYRINSKLII